MSQQINLFTPVFLKQNKLFSATAMLRALGVFVVGIAILWLMTSRQIEQLRSSAKAVASQSQKAQAQLVQMVEASKPPEKDARLASEIRAAENRLRTNQQLLNFVSSGHAGGKTAYSDYFRALARRTVPGVWLTAFSIENQGNGIEIHGRALQSRLVPAYLGALREEPLFKGKSFGSVTMRAAEAPAAQGAGAAREPGAAMEQAALSYIDFMLKSDDATDEQIAQDGEKRQ